MLVGELVRSLRFKLHSRQKKRGNVSKLFCIGKVVQHRANNEQRWLSVCNEGIFDRKMTNRHGNNLAKWALLFRRCGVSIKETLHHGGNKGEKEDDGLVIRKG